MQGERWSSSCNKYVAMESFDKLNKACVKETDAKREEFEARKTYQ